MEYNLLQILDHPLMLGELLPSALVVFDGVQVTEYRIQVCWKGTAFEEEQQDTLVIRWDLAHLEGREPKLRQKVENMQERDRDRARQIENAAVVVTAAVLHNIQPGTLFWVRSDKGTYHDYFLTEEEDEMVEIAGRGTTDMGLDRLFLEKKAQSDKNPTLRKRWVSVTIFANPRNRTEAVHP